MPVFAPRRPPAAIGPGYSERSGPGRTPYPAPIPAAIGPGYSHEGDYLLGQGRAQMRSAAPQLGGAAINSVAPAGSLEAHRDAMFAGQADRLAAGVLNAPAPQPVRQSAMMGFNQPNPARAQADAMLSSGGVNPQNSIGLNQQGLGYQPFGGAFVPGLTVEQKMAGLTRRGTAGHFIPNPTNQPGLNGGQYTASSSRVSQVHTRRPGVLTVVGNASEGYVDPPGFADRRQVAANKRQQTQDFRTLARAKKYGLDPRYAPLVWQAAQRQGITLPQMVSSIGGGIRLEDLRQNLSPGPWLPPIGPKDYSGYGQAGIQQGSQGAPSPGGSPAGSGWYNTPSAGWFGPWSTSGGGAGGAPAPPRVSSMPVYGSGGAILGNEYATPDGRRSMVPAQPLAPAAAQMVPNPNSVSATIPQQRYPTANTLGDAFNQLIYGAPGVQRQPRIGRYR